MYYDGFELPGKILKNWIENLGKNFIVVEENGKLMGHIFWEQLEEIKAIPFSHSSKDFHRPTGKYFNISEIGVLHNDLELLQQLFQEVIKSAEEKQIKGIIWVTGEKEKGHDSMERNMIEKNGFKEFKHAGKWEYAPGEFSENHWIFLKEF